MAKLPDNFWDEIENDDTPAAPPVPKGWTVEEDEPVAPKGYTREEFDEPVLPVRAAPKRRAFIDDDFDDDVVPIKAAPKARRGFLVEDFDDETPIEKLPKRRGWDKEGWEETPAAVAVEAPQEPKAPYVLPVTQLSKRALLVSLNISQWSGRRLDRQVSAEVNAQKAASNNAGRYNKVLLPDCAELAEVHRQTSSLRNWFVEKTLPWMNDGARITPSSTYLDFTSEFRAKKADWDRAVDALIAAYPALKAKAPQQLQSMYNPDDYPQTWELKGKFGMAIRCFPLPDKADFRVELDDATMDALRDSMEDTEADLARQVVADCYSRLNKAVGAMADRLKDPDAIFRDSLIENLAEATMALKDLNIAGDPALEDMRRKVEATLGKYSADELRNNMTTRSKAATAAKDMSDKMSAIMGSL